MWVFSRKRKVVFRFFKRKIRRRILKTNYFLARHSAILWKHWYKIRYGFLVWLKRHGPIIGALVLGLLITFSSFWIVDIQEGLENYFLPKDRSSLLSPLFLTIGGTLIGAAAIVSSLVLFAMQVNIERMPHGLFKKLSSDRKLLLAFLTTFVLAIGISVFSLLPMPQYVGIALLGAFWGTIIVLTLFLYSYKRALFLVNPLRQLEMVFYQSKHELQAWGKRAKRAESLFSSNTPPQNNSIGSSHDLARTAFFQINSKWTEGALQGLQYAVSFVKRYGEKGDYEVSAFALKTILAINKEYIEIKGNTFFTQQIILDNPLTSDGFITTSLEHLRQASGSAVAIGDEQQIEQILRTFAGLAHLYSRIDYSTLGASKTHAHIAIAYLTGEIDRIVPHQMADVLVGGLRLMGQCAEGLLVAEGASGITTVVKKLGAISCVGVVQEKYRPVTLTGMEQLANLSLGLLRSNSNEVRFAAQEIRGSVKLIVKNFISVPDTPLENIHSTYLAPYYGFQNLVSNISELAQAVLEAEEGNADVQKIIRNFEEWADGMFETEKELLLLAVEKRSSFTFDILHWVTSITSILIAMSNSPNCEDYTQAKIQSHAKWLIAILSWIPDDQEIISFVENFQFTENLFKSAIDAQEQNCPEISQEINKIFLSWMFKAGNHQTGWGTLEMSVYGLSTLALLSDDHNAVDKLKRKISENILQQRLTNSPVLHNAVREILQRSQRLHQRPHLSSAIENYMAQVDQEKLKSLLQDIAEILSPPTNT